MKKLLIVGIVALLLGVFFTQTASAQAPVVSGMVYLTPGSDPMQGVVIQLLKINNINPLRGQDTTDVNGFYEFATFTGWPGLFYVHLVVPEGYTVDQNDDTLYLDYCGEYEVDFVLQSETPPPEPGTIQGTVYFEPGSDPFEGIIVNLRSGFQGPILETEATDINGFYDFTNLPAGDYYVDIVVPVGYFLTTPNDVQVVLPEGGFAIVDFHLELGEIQGHVYFGPGSDPFEGVVVNLRSAPQGTILETENTNSSGFYDFTNLPADTYYVDIVVPDGYLLTTPNDVQVVLPEGGLVIVDFHLEAIPPEPAEIQGTVYIMPCSTVVPNVTVYLLDGFSSPLDTALTDINGFYDFPNLPAGNYKVQIVVPVGYSVNQNNVPETLVEGEIAIINFILTTCGEYAGYAGSVGFWKQQGTCKGGSVYTQAQMAQFAQQIFNTFYLHPTNPIWILGVTYNNNNPPCALTYAEIQNLLNNNSNNMLIKAKKQYLAVFLNIVSGRLDQTDWISYDHAYASQGVVYVNQIFFTPTQTESAKNIAEAMNIGDTLPAGVIPLSTPYIIFGGIFEDVQTVVVETFRFDSPYPNPFNPQTTLQFNLENSSNVSLVVYNTSGREVARLVDGYLNWGQHQVIFNADNLPTGVYFARLTADNFVKTQKLLLVK